MNILITLDRNYFTPLRVLLYSLFESQEALHIYLISEGFSAQELTRLTEWCQAHGAVLHPIPVLNELFAEAPVFRHFSRAMYYRLLAQELLPSDVERVLYLDPDILALRPLDRLYHTSLENYYYAAAAHSDKLGLTNRIQMQRLGIENSAGYFNSGVLLIHLSALRETVAPAEIFSYVRENKRQLILPDQDVLNGMYGPKIKSIDDSEWNLDPRWYPKYELQDGKNLDWIMKHTALIHFCGKHKPWQEDYTELFGALYKDWQNRAEADWRVQSGAAT